MANKKLTVGLPADPNDPEDFDVSDAAIEQALAEREARRARRVGRPEGSDKERITIRLDKDLLTRFRATGPGWQSRINEALRAAVMK
ncbi:MAG TPA: BrnA antitoxin family protein [Rhizorhapis sp.]